MYKRLARDIFIMAAVLGAAAPAMAQGGYAAIDVGQSNATDICSLAGVSISGCKDTATAFRLAGGYKFTPNWGAEASYAYFGSDSRGTAAGLSLGDWRATGFEIAGTGTLPLSDGFDLFAKLGVASTKLHLSSGHSSTKTNVAGGIGAQYNFMQNFGVRAQYEDFGTIGDSATTGTTKLTLISAGLVYRFY